jgi:hypothetical protein
MVTRVALRPRFHHVHRANRLLAAAAILVALLVGCQRALRVDDPQLRPIQQMLETQLPPGTSEDRVTIFLSARGYPIEPSEKPGTLVAIIRHIDTERVQPVTARVTFYFDATGRLNTFDLVRIANQPIQ